MLAHCKTINPPACVCFRRKWTRWQSYEVEKIRIDTFRCDCIRPALYIENDGGNAFVVPKKEIIAISPEMSHYVDEILVQFFKKNMLVLEKLREHIEQELIKCHLPEIGLDPRKPLPLNDQELMAEVDDILLSVYASGHWWSPMGFNDTPTPPDPPHNLIVYVKKRGLQNPFWMDIRNNLCTPA